MKTKLFIFSLFIFSSTAFGFEQCSYQSETVAFRKYAYESIKCTDRKMIDRFREARINIENNYGDWRDMKEGFKEGMDHFADKKGQEAQHRAYLNNRIREDRGSSNEYRVAYSIKPDRNAIEQILRDNGYATVDHITFVKFPNPDRIDPSGRVDSSERGSVKEVASSSAKHNKIKVNRE
jgi:hypothetical protein